MDATDIEKLAAEQEAFTDPTDPTVTGKWAIQDIGSLEWAMSRIADLQAEDEENRAALAEAHRRIEKRGEELAKRVARGVGFFRAAVIRYLETHKAELLKGGARKSRTLIYGTVGFRKAGGRLKVVDKDALVEWVTAQPVEMGFARIKVEPAMTALQEHAKKLGVIPPGTEWEAEREAPYVTALTPGTTLTKREDDDAA